MHIRTFSEAPKGGKWIIFDFDSTLSSLEGIDELARMASSDAFQLTKNLTDRAMEGKIRMEDVFAERIDFLHPPREHFNHVASLYLDTVEPTAVATLAKAREAGWTPMILSGGFKPAILPVAEHLGIKYTEAVDVFFNEDGSYKDFDRLYPTTFQDGKPTIISELKKTVEPEQIIMVGDGATDKLTEPLVTHFFAFGRYAKRNNVWESSTQKIESLDELVKFF